MGMRDKYRLPMERPKGINVDLVTRKNIRLGKIPPYFPPYIKRESVDYDFVITIPSHGRYEKVRRMIAQYYEQANKYSIKIILLNDGSTDERYDTLPEEFPDLIYLKNDEPNGKINHWYCYNQMWEYVKEIDCHAILQTDDDFILSDDFLTKIGDMYFNEKKKYNGILAIAPHLWSFKEYSEYEWHWTTTDFMDGIALIDVDVIKKMDYQMTMVDADIVRKSGEPVRTWSQINNTISEMKGMIKKTDESLVYHDGNDESKLHTDARIGGGVYTQKYIGKL